MSDAGATTPKPTPKRGNPQNLKPAWQPGQSGNPKGRTKGARNKLGEAFLDALQADFAEHGVAAIQKVRTDRPHEYLKVVASILPKELNVNQNALGDMTDDELVGLIDGVRAVLIASSTETAGSRGKAASRH